MAGAREVIDEQLQRIGDEIMSGIPSSWKYVLILHDGGTTTWLSNSESPEQTRWLLKKCVQGTDEIIKAEEGGT